VDEKTSVLQHLDKYITHRVVPQEGRVKISEGHFSRFGETLVSQRVECNTLHNDSRPGVEFQ
jgi:hypothetical protein